MRKNSSGYKKFLLLWGGEMISSIGGGLTSFGLGVYVFNEMGSAAGMSLLSLLAFLPTLILSAPAGVLADRYDRRVLMMLGDGLSGMGVLYILICLLLGRGTLLNIYIGVTVSAVFSALLEPSYKATITDLLTEEEYSKASGMVSAAGSARYLISPVLAGLLMTVSDIKLLLLIDICTFFITVITTGIVKKGIAIRKKGGDESLRESFKVGWKAVSENPGLRILVIVSGIMTCFLGTFQVLSKPIVLDFTDSTTLGTVETVCACGMLVSALILGIKGLKKNYAVTLTIALSFAGIAMTLFGIKQNICFMSVVGFLFFAALPFANTCLDYLTRISIPQEKQGRVWGVIGFLSQLGYVASYGFAGILADTVSAGKGISVGQGASRVVIVSGILLVATAVIPSIAGPVRKMEMNSLKDENK